MVRWCRLASEAVLLAMACLAPWALGSVPAQCEVYLSAGVVALALLGAALACRGEGRPGAWTCVPSLGMAGLVVLALVQWAPLPGFALRGVAPELAALRGRLLPQAAERVVEDPGPTVALSPPSISQDRDATVQAGARLASAWIVFQAVLGLGPGFAPFRRFALAIGTNATLLALFSLVQRLTWNGKIYGRYPAPFNDGGPFVSHNHLAAYLNLGLGFALGLLLSPRRGGLDPIGAGRRLWAGYAAGVIMVGIVASHSRSAFLAMVLALLLALAVLRPRGAVLATFVGSALVLIPILLYVLGGSAPYQERLATLLARASYANRFDLWRDAIRAWPVSPILGTGLGNFAVATARFYRSDTGDRFLHAENEYLEWLVEGGAVGFGLALVGVVGVGRLAARALRGTSDVADRAAILGASFGGVTLLAQSVADFAPHIPGVSVAAVILCGYLGKAGLEALGSSTLPAPPGLPAASRARRAVAALAVAALSVVLWADVSARARAERELTENTPFAPAGALPLTPDNENFGWPDELGWPEAEAVRDALDRALDDRPNWAEGHLRRGTLLLALYRRWVAEGFDRQGQLSDAPAKRGELADPAFLYKQVHVPEGEEPMPREALLGMEPVRLYLVPAARSFLEARRCDPLLPLPYAKLAVLDYLLEGGDPAPAYLGRALRLARADRPVLEEIVRTAGSMEEWDAAAEGLRRLLLLDPGRWEEIADAARDLNFAPDRILERVVPDGLAALRFADRLYAAPWRADARRRFLEEAARRLPGDPGLAPAERLRYEAEAWARLGDRGKALERMRRALRLEPRRSAWRETLVAWLTEWGLAREAREVALEGLRYSPNDPEARRLLARTLAGDPAGGAPRGPMPGPGPPGDRADGEGRTEK